MMNYKQLEIEAALMGSYALYRYTFMRYSMKGCLERLYSSGKLNEHLSCVQKATEMYMNHYLDNYRRSVSFNVFSREECDKFLEEISKVTEKEEERIGNLWICRKNPYDSEEFCFWSTEAEVCQ